nr:unnamed protein product [Callosobruchus chinensis]
MTWRRSQDDLN